LIERTRAEGELLEAQESLRNSDRRKDEFLAILAHELRNPLSPVRNAANVLKHKPMADAEARRSIDMIDRQVTQMARLIDDLLDVSRITRGVVELHLERVDFADVARAVLEASESDLESRGHTLSVRMPREPIALRADRHRLAQVFGNLIGNAAKYTPAGGHIAFDAHVDGDVLEAVVRDDGVGIPPAKLTEIFELFAQVDRSLERETGLGIGLTLARQLVELHRGTIEARSEGPGQGSTFVVRLPIDVTAPIAAEPEQRQPAVRTRRILVVDDNRDAAESLALLLDAAGHTVRFATDGGAALDMAGEFRPEAAFVDIGMPRMNGYELAQRLRAEPWGAAIYLVALTGWGQEADRRRSGEAGFDAHIVKPASPAAIDEVLGADGCACARDRAQRERSRSTGEPRLRSALAGQLSPSRFSVCSSRAPAKYRSSNRSNTELAARCTREQGRRGTQLQRVDRDRRCLPPSARPPRARLRCTR
jgi:CheY-like chemotaxis protein